MLRDTMYCFCVILTVGVFLCTGCSGDIASDPQVPTLTTQPSTMQVETPTRVDNTSTPEAAPTRTTQPSTVQVEPTPNIGESTLDITPTPASLMLPIKRQIPPTDIQTQVRWFDAGAGSGNWMGCRYFKIADGLKVRVVPSSKLEGLPILEGQPIEGDPIAVCVRDLALEDEEFSWVLETADGEAIDSGEDKFQSGNAEFWPDFDYVRGTYRIRIVLDNEFIETTFRILPSESPTIWIVGERIPGQTFTMHYAGFDAGEHVTTVWYDGSDYLTFWKSTADVSGQIVENFAIPNDFCVSSFLLVAAVGENPQQKSWVFGGWDIELFASTIYAMQLELDCTEEETGSSRPEENRASTSRFLKQVDMGEIREREIQYGTLSSLLEIHNWIYKASAGEAFTIYVEFLDNPSPKERISILEPNGSIVYECVNTISGCGAQYSKYDGVTEVEYLPTDSGSYTISVDMFDDRSGAYSIYVESMNDNSHSMLVEVIIDDLDPELLLEGPSEGWRIAPYGYKGLTHWTYCTDAGASNWAKWTPRLAQEGYYEVLVFVPEHNAGTTQAEYHIIHNGVEDIVRVRQSNYANEWVSLGKYRFAADGQEYLHLDDNTGEPRSTNTTIAFDAVKFVYVP